MNIHTLKIHFALKPIDSESISQFFKIRAHRRNAYLSGCRCIAKLRYRQLAKTMAVQYFSDRNKGFTLCFIYVMVTSPC